MSLSPRSRRLILTVHVTTAVGWLGAVVAFGALCALALTSPDVSTVRGALLMMEPIGLYVLVPLAVATLVIGAIQSLGTVWGLFRHYWVLFKLAITALATGVLITYLDTLGQITMVASDATSTMTVLRAQAGSPLLHAVLALFALLAATVLAVYKPRGMTAYGQRKQREPRTRRSRPGRSN